MVLITINPTVITIFSYNGILIFISCLYCNRTSLIVVLNELFNVFNFLFYPSDIRFLKW
jgi:hypothetical protein